MEFYKKEIRLKDGTACILRSPNAQDAEKMLEHLRITAGETDFLVRYPEEVCLTLEEEQKFLNENLASCYHMMIGAFIDCEVAGSAGIGCIGSRRKLRHRAELGIAIQRPYWNRGIGSALMQEALEQAKKIGYEQVELGVYAANERAVALYQKFGFEVWGRTKNAFKLKDGTYHDELLMGRGIA